MFAPSTPYAAKPEQDALWNRGAYIVQGPGHCGSCHTPRGLAFNEKALDESGAPFLAGALLDGWYAPSLRQDPNTGLGRWSEPQIVQFLKTGRNAHAVVYGSMTEAFNNSTQFMQDDDLAAIARYLKSLPGDPQRDGTPWQYQTATASTGPGAHTFATRCASCHGLDGKGQPEWMPPLAGATSALAKESASAINITILLANSYWSDFNGKDERSWQAGYGLDFSAFGVPGLTYNIAYVRGTNIDDGSNRGSGTEREIFNQFKYVVQSGPAKDLSLRARASWLRVSNNASNYNVGGNEIRLFADYPINVF